MKKILVIDDESWLREMVHLALTQQGYDVVEAGDGADGINVARSQMPDLVLCDVNMQGISGYETLSALRSEPTTALIPFILMTGLADNEGMRHGMELGADDYLPKPFTIDALYAAVDTRLRKAQSVQKQAEQKLADLRGNLSLMLPHELKTPLNGILAYGEILAADAANIPPHELAEMGQVILESGKQLQRLVENFLIYAQIEMLGEDPQKAASLRQKSTAQPARIVESQARAQADSAKRLADLRLNLSNHPVAISEEYLGRIVVELVQNAFKFSPPGSSVEVTLTEAPNASVLTVTDQGRGFETEHITKIGAYMQFDRKMNEQQGQGLGLVIAKRLTELHNGTLTIESQRGARTTVTVKLPKARS